MADRENEARLSLIESTLGSSESLRSLGTALERAADVWAGLEDEPEVALLPGFGERLVALAQHIEAVASEMELLAVTLERHRPSKMSPHTSSEPAKTLRPAAATKELAMNDNPTLKDLYVAQVVMLAHVLRIEAERMGHTKDIGLHLDEAERLLTSGTTALLERRQRQP